MLDLLKRFNWVDILVIALAVRIVYVSIKAGFVAEFMKALAVIIAVFLGFHYYVKLAAFVGHYAGFSEAVLQVAAFLVLWLVTVFVCKLSRDGILLIFSIKPVSSVDRWGAVIIALPRFFVTASMFMFVFLLTDHPYLERMTLSSVSQKYVLTVAPKVYRKIANGFVAKFFSGEKAKPAVFEELTAPGKKK